MITVFHSPLIDTSYNFTEVSAEDLCGRTDMQIERIKIINNSAQVLEVLDFREGNDPETTALGSEPTAAQIVGNAPPYAMADGQTVVINGFTATIFESNVLDIGAVTYSEVETAINNGIGSFLVAVSQNETNELVIESVSTGASASLVVGAHTAAALGIALGTYTGEDSESKTKVLRFNAYGSSSDWHELPPGTRSIYLRCGSSAANVSIEARVRPI
jgi:hypothetical protein